MGAPLGAGRGTRRFALATFLFCCLIVAYTTLLPFQFTRHQRQRHSDENALTLRQRDPAPLADVVGNVVLFLPVGVCALLMQPHGSRKSVRVGLASCCGLFFSVGIESLQFFTPSRDPSLDDIVSNTVGTLLGAGLAAFLVRPLSNARRVKALDESTRNEFSAVVLLGLLLLTGAWALVPFDVSLHPTSLARSLRTMRLNLLWGGSSTIDVTSGLFFALSAGLGIHLLNEQRPTRRFHNVLMLLAAVGVWSLSLEVIQLALKSRITAVQDVVTATAGGIVGILVAVSIRRVQSRRARRYLLVFAYLAGLVLLALRPLGTGFGVEVIQHRLAILIPGYVIHFDGMLADVTRFAHGLLLFVPLGYLLGPGAWPLSPLHELRGGLLLLLGCGLVAVAMNGVMALTGNGSVSSHLDVVGACLGGVLGACFRSWHLEHEFGSARTAAPPAAVSWMSPVPAKGVQTVKDRVASGRSSHE